MPSDQDPTPERIEELQAQLDQNLADHDLTQEEYDEGNAMLRGLRERDELRARVEKAEARLRVPCAGCPGCPNDCPDARDRMEMAEARAKEPRP